MYRIFICCPERKVRRFTNMFFARTIPAHRHEFGRADKLTTAAHLLQCCPFSVEEGEWVELRVGDDVHFQMGNDEKVAEKRGRQKAECLDLNI
jgi:hypothetical protein